MGRGLFLAIILCIACLSSAAFAQKTQRADDRPQSTIQVLRDPEPAERSAQAPAPKLVEVERPRQVNPSAPAPEPIMDGVVVPPAPLVSRRSTNSVSIPAETPKAEGKYQERPASSARIGSSFGYRRDPFHGRSKFHSGVDIKAKLGDPVGASHQGTVIFSNWHHGYGNLIIVDHGGGVTTYYAHLSAYALAPGDRVKRGTIVGYAGSTGRATSPHLHYELRINENPVDPLEPIALDPSSGFFVDTDLTKAGTPANAQPEIVIRPHSMIVRD